MQKFREFRGLKFGSIQIFGVFHLQEVPPTSSCTDEFIKINGVCGVCGQLAVVAPLHPRNKLRCYFNIELLPPPAAPILSISCHASLGVSCALSFVGGRFFIRLTVSVSSPASVCRRRENVCKTGWTAEAADIASSNLHRDWDIWM